MAEPLPILIRPCFDQDIEQIQLIYAHYVLTSAATFEIEPPSFAAMRERWANVVARNGPWLVASPNDDITRVLGFAYAAPFRDRPAYAHTFEDSVYLAPSAQRKGVGGVLLSELLEALRDDGVLEVIAMIGGSDNEASIRLHAKCGFEEAGLLRNVGAKFERWHDVVVMQRHLRPRS